VSDGNYYLGAQDAGSSATDESLIEFIVKRIMNRRTHVEIVQVQGVSNTPGQVAKTGTVNVLPLTNQLDGYGNARKHTTVNGISYFRHGGGSNAILLDPQVGDVGIMVVADKDTSVVRSTGAQANPGSRSRSNRADGIYIGLCVAGSPNQYIAFTANGITIADKNGNVLTTNGSGPLTITAPNGMVVNGATITAAGDVIAANGVSLETHVHSDAGGSGNSGPPVP
jgi:hypothetical protein